MPLTYDRHDAGHVAEALTAAGSTPYATVRREAVLSFETTPQTSLLVQRS